MHARSGQQRAQRPGFPVVDVVQKVGDQLDGILLKACAEILHERRPVRGVPPVGQRARHRDRQLPQRNHPGDKVTHVCRGSVIDVTKCADHAEDESGGGQDPLGTASRAGVRASGASVGWPAQPAQADRAAGRIPLT